MPTLTLPHRIDPAAMLKALDKEACEQSFIEFVKRAWPVLEPGQPYVHNWHADFIGTHLEAISDGETADGEVYNRLLINVPPGFSKPVHVDEMVFTDCGFVRLGDICVGDRVLTHRGRFRSVTAVHEQGALPTIQVGTFSGRNVRTAFDHPFLTPRGWVSAGDLTLQDYVGAPHRTEDFGDRSMRPEEARLLGYLVGDGCISQRSLAFVNMDRDAIDDFIQCATICGFYAYEAPHSNKRVQASKIVLKSSETRVAPGFEPPVLDWLRSHDLYRSNSYTKRIPEGVFRSGPEAIGNFLGAYWSCDGTVGVRHDGKKTSMLASATTVSEGLAHDVHRALMALNIKARVRRREARLETASQPGGVYVYFDIQTSERGEVAKIAKLPGLMNRKRLIAAQAFFDRFDPHVYEDAVNSLEDAGFGECRCLTVDEDASFTIDGLIVHNSMIVSVFFPAWEWGPRNMPHLRYICASHSFEDVALRDNLRMRRLIESDWYQGHWGDRVILTGDQNSKKKFENTAGGWRHAIATGSITGARADRCLLDDLNSVDGANSDATRTSVNTWFNEALPTRLNNPISSAIVVVMQRLHEDDISGQILDRHLGYDHIMLPMHFDPDRCIPTKLGLVDPRTERGELLFPERFPADVVERDSKILGPYAAAGQFEQCPVPRGGGIIKDAWWRLWSAREYPPIDFIVASLDTAYTEKEENDYSAMTVWGVSSSINEQRATRMVDRYGRPKDVELSYDSAMLPVPRLIMMFAWQERLGLHELVKKAAKTCKDLKVDRLLVENKASGISVAQELRRLFGHEPWAVHLIDPKSIDKVSRLYSVQHIFAEGMVYAPDKDWAEMVIRQVSTFPKGKYKDLTDTVSQALKHMRECGLLTRSDEMLAAHTQSQLFENVKPQGPLYAV
jgi:predicted phage terminase large subunit-like protein